MAVNTPPESSQWVKAVNDYPEIAERYQSGFADLAEVLPNTTSTFGRLVMNATEDGSVSVKTKELMALAIAITVQCDGCLAHHALSVVRMGATRQEVAETIGVAIMTGGSPATVYGAEALHAYDVFAARVSAGNISKYAN